MSYIQSMIKQGKTDKCYGGKNGWAECTSCGGRIHKQECSAVVNPAKDCCPKRHIKQGLDPQRAQIRKGE